MELTITEKKGQFYADSREVSIIIGQRHKDLLRSIRHYCEIIANQRKSAPVDYFVEATYKDGKGERRPRYNVTRKGCDLIAHKLTGEKGILFSTAYIDRFYEMERALMERKTPAWEEARLEGKKSPANGNGCYQGVCSLCRSAREPERG